MGKCQEDLANLSTFFENSYKFYRRSNRSLPHNLFDRKEQANSKIKNLERYFFGKVKKINKIIIFRNFKISFGEFFFYRFL